MGKGISMTKEDLIALKGILEDVYKRQVHDLVLAALSGRVVLCVHLRHEPL